MSNISSLDKLKRLSFETISLAIAVVVFTLSSLFIHNGFIRTTFVLQQTVVFAILGFFHAYNVWELDNIISRQKQSMFMLFCYFLVYTAWYNVVLLPLSGLGIVEWVIVLVILTSNIFTELTSKKINNPFMGQRPIVLIFFGIILFIAKIILFHSTNGDNVYDSLILGNPTARFLVGIFSCIGVIILLMQLYKHITNKIGININKSKIQKFFEKIVSLIKKIIVLLISIISLPVLIIIIAIVGLIILGVGFVQVTRIYDDVLKIVEYLLENWTSTGENSLHPSNFYYTLQTISMVIVLFYTVYIEKIMRLSIEKDIEKQIRLEFDKLNTNDNDQLFSETKQLLLDNRFDEQLRIFGNKTIVKETIKEKMNNLNKNIGDNND